MSSSTCVEQNAWPGNRVVKCADAYIFRRKCNEGACPCHEDAEILLCSMWDLSANAVELCKPCRYRLCSQNDCLGCRNPAAALSITNMMNPHLFFLHPYRSCSPETSSSTSSTWRRSRCHKTSRGSGRMGWRGRRRRPAGRPRGRHQGQARSMPRNRYSRGGAIWIGNSRRLFGTRSNVGIWYLLLHT